MKKRRTLNECKAMLPLVVRVAAEISSRVRELKSAEDVIARLSLVRTPEGVGDSLSCAEDEAERAQAGIDRCKLELKSLGLRVTRVVPVTVHFPGHDPQRTLTFCWKEGDETICHGHATGEENEPRRPLRIKPKS